LSRMICLVGFVRVVILSRGGGVGEVGGGVSACGDGWP
jgi:hypothetical protein